MESKNLPSTFLLLLEKITPSRAIFLSLLLLGGNSTLLGCAHTPKIPCDKVLPIYHLLKKGVRANLPNILEGAQKAGIPIPEDDSQQPEGVVNIVRAKKACGHQDNLGEIAQEAVKWVRPGTIKIIKRKN